MNGAECIIKLDSAEIEMQHKGEIRKQGMKAYYDSINLKNCIVTDPKGDVLIQTSNHHRDNMVMTLKKKWFDMILSGEKTEEYREIKPYWETRFTRYFGRHYDFAGESTMLVWNGQKKDIVFRNGYKLSAGKPTVLTVG